MSQEELTAKWDLSPNESILCTYKGVIDGKHLFVPVTQGEIEIEPGARYYRNAKDLHIRCFNKDCRHLSIGTHCGLRKTKIELQKNTKATKDSRLRM